MVHSVLCIVHGVCCMVNGKWYIVDGLSSTDRALFTQEILKKKINFSCGGSGCEIKYFVRRQLTI